MILDHISHSQIEMYLRCPRQWMYRYVQGLKIPPSGALIEGSCYHKALEGNFRQKVASLEDLPLSHCLDLFSDAWELRLEEEETIDWGNFSPGAIKDQGIGLVREYRESVSPLVLPVKVEEPYVSEIAGVKFVSFVDLEDAHGVIIDHKTSSKAYTQDDVDKSLQASAEAFVLNKAIVFHNHIAIKTRMPKIQIVKTVRMRADIEWYVDMVARIIVQMKTGVAPPRPTGWWCSERFCGYWNLCRGELARSHYETS